MSLSNVINKPVFMAINDNTVVNLNHVVEMTQVTSSDVQTTTFIKMIDGTSHAFDGSLVEIQEMIYPKSNLAIDASISNAMENNGKLCQDKNEQDCCF